jgi:peptide/nickel transport system permease protein
VTNRRFILRKLLTAIPLLLGVSLVSFWLMVYAGPDQTYAQLGKNPDATQIAELRHQLGYDRSVLVR